jgi:DNA-binding response OmpR family regulator
MADPVKPRALIVEDERPIRELVRLHLELGGFAVDEVCDGTEALAGLKSGLYDLVILDVMLPGLDGVTLCRAMRGAGPNRETPVLMLTAREAESDKVVGLESGADDYLTKPFGVRELMARVGAITRRHRRAVPTAADDSSLTRGDLQLDLARREALVRGNAVELTRQEFDLLHQLAARPGVVLSRTALLSHVWSDDNFVTERTVDTVVSRLRRKIERDPQDPELILTAWGVGYKFSGAE